MTLPIYVAGDSFPVSFLLPAHSIAFRLPEGTTEAAWSQTLFLPLRVGADYLTATTQEIVAQIKMEDERPAVEQRRMGSFVRLDSLQQIFNLRPGKDADSIVDLSRPGERLPYLRVAERPEILGPVTMTFEGNECPEESPPPQSILLHWLSQPRHRRPEPKVLRELPKPVPECRAHVQVGSLLHENGGAVTHPSHLARPTDIRFIVVHLSELLPNSRIRKSLSYESIAVDVLRYWRGYPGERMSPAWYELAGPEDEQPPTTCAVVCINDAACLLYCRNNAMVSTHLKDEEKEKAVLFFHGRLPAPTQGSALGGIDTYSPAIGAHLAVGFAKHAVDFDADPDLLRASALAKAAIAPTQEAGTSRAKQNGGGWLYEALSDSLQRHTAHATRGLFHVFFKDSSPPGAKVGNWEPITSPAWTDRKASFADAFAWLEKHAEAKDKKVWAVPVKIVTAVSHRAQWFFTSDIIQSKGQELETTFQERAIHWLSNAKGDGPKKDIPILEICELKLIDRREVEDYLALRDAFLAFGRAKRPPRPLNVAVFGSPGSGKSYGVKQVTAYMARDGSFSKDTKTFNVSQFTHLGDLINALHQVRSEALKGPTPVIFFDEFDSAFEGRPFGWLKYFLAPMQDGEFTDAGMTYKLGNCVLVFAGGVTRSFEELNGRSRNPSFVEAKGPDFISRLRAHLNIRGINKPEDELDQHRYILRRAIMLHDLLTKRLARPNKDLPRPLADPTVAAAFCKIASFKHNSRSLEAILDMCDLQPGRTFRSSDLPARTQLEMHVDASDFLQLIYESLDGVEALAKAD